MQVFTDLQNRGVKDILIACVDGLKGFPEAISTIYPGTEVQLCIDHQIRNSLKYVGPKNQKFFAKDLKLIYKAATEEATLAALDELEDKWDELYPVVTKSWRANWPFTLRAEFHWKFNNLKKLERNFKGQLELYLLELAIFFSSYFYKNI